MKVNQHWRANTLCVLARSTGRMQIRCSCKCRVGGGNAALVMYFISRMVSGGHGGGSLIGTIPVRIWFLTYDTTLAMVWPCCALRWVCNGCIWKSWIFPSGLS